jgi:sugar lactone lactonase YvrE
MSYARLARWMLVGAGLVVGAAGVGLSGQGQTQPINDLPNPYQTIDGWAKLPAGRTWGSTSAVDIDRDGRSVWVGERCGANTCWDAAKGEMSPLPSVLKFDPSGNLAASFGAGMLVFPHGIHVDRDGNVWVTDGQDNRPRPARGAAPGTPLPPAPAKLVGHQVIKFSPDGKVLMTLGTAGTPGSPPNALTEPNDVITAPNGDIFVAEGHSGQNAQATPDTVARISKFDRTGKFIKSWGKLGSGPGEFRTPHGLAFDSRGRLFVADRGNVRIQVFDQEGKFLEETKAFSRLSGIYIDRNDGLYGADSESAKASNPGWRRGIRVGSAKDLKPAAFIPDPGTTLETAAGTSAAEGVAVDSQGVVYGAEVGPRKLTRYVKK